MTNGLLYVVSGPGASGKGTICQAAMIKTQSPVWLSISTTTRQPRVDEVHGEHYFFVTKPEFQHMIDKGDMLEYTNFNDNYYGTPIQYFKEKLQQGVDVVLEIETDGAAQVKQRYPDIVSVFVMAPSMQALESRMRDRMAKGKPFDQMITDERESAETLIRWRMQKAQDELKLLPQYDYLIINDKLDDAVDDLLAIMRSERCSVKRSQNGYHF